MPTLAVVPSPFSSPQSWDSIVIAGNKWGPPWGSVVVKSAIREYDWQKKKPQGLEGWTQTYRGKKPRAFDLTFYFWDDLGWVRWLQLQPSFKYNGITQTVIPVFVYHPALAAIDINQVYVEGLGSPERVSEDLLYAVKVEVTEFFLPIPVPATVTPNAALAKAPVATPVAIDPEVAEAAATRDAALTTDRAVSSGEPGGMP